MGRPRWVALIPANRSASHRLHGFPAPGSRKWPRCPNPQVLTGGDLQAWHALWKLAECINMKILPMTTLWGVLQSRCFDVHLKTANLSLEHTHVTDSELFVSNHGIPHPGKYADYQAPRNPGWQRQKMYRPGGQSRKWDLEWEAAGLHGRTAGQVSGGTCKSLIGPNGNGFEVVTFPPGTRFRCLSNNIHTHRNILNF